MNIDLHENAERALRMVREAEFLSYDTESTGIDWRVNKPIGYVLGAPKQPYDALAPDDVVYVPVRHGGGGNLPGARPMTSPTEGYEPHPWEAALADAFDYRNNHSFPSRGRVIGHNTKFDVHFSANAGVMLGRRLACTQNQEAMLDEYARSYSLSACAEKRGVTAKKGEELYAYLASLFGGPPERGQMANYWRLAGNDPLGYDYATGDGVTTYELYWEQEKKIQEENLGLVADMENDLIWTVFRMERRGIKVDLNRVEELRSATEARIRAMLESFPLGFNVRSPAMMKKVMEESGHTDWPKTEKGNPSFTEKWLKSNDLGKKVIRIRQASNLINSFVNPLAERHVFKGRVHANLNQMKSDDKGTISGRFSCDSPNLQQVPKRVKEIAKPFRRLFVADEGYTFWERDFSQCFVAGTQVTIPGGTKNIEDMAPGDWVYSYDDDLNLVLRKVTWAGRTGTKPVFRVYWKTNGRTSGYLDCTGDHRIRKVDGQYVTVDELMAQRGKSRKGTNPLWVPVLAMSRTSIIDPRHNYEAIWMRATGARRFKEARFVFEQVNGWSPEEVHHGDEDPTNNAPGNLIGLSSKEHRAKHLPYGMSKLTPEQRVARSRIATEGLRAAMNNHAIVDVVQISTEAVPVYDITVEDTHNFIANEVCVHNCEPRLFAHYSQDPNLLEGYNATPFVDAHQTVANLLNVERDPTAKRMNMGIFTGMQVKSFAGHMNWSVEKATQAWNAWNRAFPGIQDFQNKAKIRLKNRGYVMTLLGRRGRLEDPRFAYRGVSKIIQGSNADIVKWKLLEADRACEDNGDIVQVLMTVHDSYNGQFENTSQARALFEGIVREMAEVQIAPFNLSVPFVLEGGEGGDWCEATFGEVSNSSVEGG